MKSPNACQSSSAGAARFGQRAARFGAWLALLLALAILDAPVATAAATVWHGPKLVFAKGDGTDPGQAGNQDRLTATVWLTRGSSQGLYNVARESSFTHSVSPADTEWATGTTASYQTLNYSDWESWARGLGKPPATVGVDAVLHLKTDDIYLDIKFLTWSQRPASGDGFAYERSTAGPAATDLSFVPGWNLVGNSVEATLAVASLFGDPAKVDSVWKWIAGGSNWAFYAPAQADAGAAYAASKGYGFLGVVAPGEGFWVKAVAAFSVPLPTGLAVQSSSFRPTLSSPATPGGSHALPAGWSLIAVGDSPSPAQFDAAIATVLASAPAAGKVYTNLTTLWAWDATQQRWYFWAPALVNSDGLAAHLTSKGYLDFSTLANTPGGNLPASIGYWVNMP